MSSKITVQLSEEKLAAIQALFAYNGWDWNPEKEVVPVATTPVSPPNTLYPSSAIIDRMPRLPLSAMRSCRKQQTSLVA